ncbi:MAG: hypothetical protein ACK58L_09405 [Planctomycetota bacterium]
MLWEMRPLRWLHVLLMILIFQLKSLAQQSPYDVFPSAEPPYFRVRLEAGAEPGQLIFPVNFTIWIPEHVKTLRGIVIHQHGCGEGSCRSGLTGAWDLHWQALARQHDCALLAPAFEQPEGADCQMWCDPRNGSASALFRGLTEFAKQTGHPELTDVPWALWGHSGGGHWAGGLVMLYPERVAAAWLRSGVPLLEPDPGRAGIKPHVLSDAALRVPVMCNPGTKEGVTVRDGRFAGVWPANETFFKTVRSKGGLIGVAVDPLSSHECGNQRYMAIPWLDACLSARLPVERGQALRDMPTQDVWLAEPAGFDVIPADSFQGDALTRSWLPNEVTAKLWKQYVRDTVIGDETAPPAPENVILRGRTLSWTARADVESGLSGFVIEVDGKAFGRLPETSVNPFGRPIFQNLQYSDTPTQPLVEMRFELPETAVTSQVRILAINTVGHASVPSELAKVISP